MAENTRRNSGKSESSILSDPRRSKIAGRAACQVSALADALQAAAERGLEDLADLADALIPRLRELSHIVLASTTDAVADIDDLEGRLTHG